MSDKTILEQWRSIAYDQQADRNKLQRFWANYFNIEKGIYEQLLTNPDEVVTGTVKELAEKKAKLGTSCMKDFNFHTAHLKYTVSQALILNLGEKGEEAVKLALADYVDTFGQEYLDVLNGLYPVE